MKDAYGNTIQKGDVIAYPGRQGSNMWMNTAVVREVAEKPHPWRDNGATTKYLKVASIYHKFNYFPDVTGENFFSWEYRNTCVYVTDRVIPIDPANIDEERRMVVLRVLKELSD